MNAASRSSCVTDATHLRGLADLRRRFPRSWAKKMRHVASPVGPEATVAEALRAGGMGLLLPRASTDAEARRLKKLRHCARKVMRAYGDVQIDTIDDAWLRRARRRADVHMDVGRDVAGAAFTLLRKVVFAAQEWGGTVRVRARLAPRRRPEMGSPPDRPVAPWPTLEFLVSRGRLRTRALVALGMHIGASSTRVLGMRVRDLDLDAGLAWCRIPGRGQTNRIRYPLPRDAARAIRPWWNRMRTRGPDAPLFPQRGRPRRPTRSVNRALRQEARRWGLEPTTMAAIRRYGQAGLRGVGAVRSQVRGSARRPSVGRGIRERDLDRQRAAWAFQLGAEERAVPSRAPRRCHADEPERTRRRLPRGWRAERHRPTPLERRTPWGEQDRAGTNLVGRPGVGGAGAADGAAGASGAALPNFVGRPMQPEPVFVRQMVPGPPSAETLAAIGLSGLVVGATLALQRPDVVERALKVGVGALAEVARDLLAAERP